ncbi:hypothetical protein ACWDTG_09715 [Rhodococcus zopfii]
MSNSPPAEIHRAQRLVLLVGRVAGTALVAVQIGHMGAVPGILDDQYIAG